MNIPEPFSDGTTTYTYSAHECSCADLDGDGKYELVVKWFANHKDNAMPGITGNVYLDAYEMGGEQLWRIDLGRNIRAGQNYTQFVVYDFDKDGVAELSCKTAPGSKDGVGNYVSAASRTDAIKSVDNETVYVNEKGFVLEGDEYYTVFDGRTGAAIDTIYYPVNRYPTNGWGKTSDHTNRLDRYLAGVAYLDGKTPSIIAVRGYYGRTTLTAMNLENGRLVIKNQFDTNVDGTQYEGQGNHNFIVADIDSDGKDEILLGGICLDDDLDVLWCSYRGHGDAMHIGNYDPTHDGFEFFAVHESGGSVGKDGTTILDYGMTLFDAKTGEEFFHLGNTKDTEACMLSNVGAGGYYQFWGLNMNAYRGMGDKNVELIQLSGATSNFRIFWDGDLYDELLDYTSIKNWNGSGFANVFTATNCADTNDNKHTPALQADLFGDWREEVVFPLKGYSTMRVFTTNIYTDYKMKTLMNDSLYRNAIVAQNSAYNQPPHISMYLSEDILNNLGALTGMKITREPARKSYQRGQQLDLAGLEVEAVYKNGTKKITDFEVSGFDSDKAGTQTLTVTSDGKNVGCFDVYVEDASRTILYNSNFAKYSFDLITIAPQGIVAQTQTLDKLTLAVGCRGSEKNGDGVSGFGFAEYEYGTKLACYSGRYAGASRGGYFNFNECNLPQFAELAANATMVIDFNVMYHDANSNIQLFGVTSSEIGDANGFYDPYLSAKKNTAIPLGEWVNVKIEIDSTKKATLVITDISGEILDKRSFTTSGTFFEKAAFYTIDSIIDIGYFDISIVNSGVNITVTDTQSGKISAKVENNTTPAVLLLLVYRSDGTLDSVSIEAVVADEAVTFDEVNILQSASFRIFAWKDLKTICPVTKGYMSDVANTTLLMIGKNDVTIK